jgi:hypothetical protein
MHFNVSSFHRAQRREIMQIWEYKELVCKERNDGLNVEWEDGRRAEERFPAQYRSLSGYLNMLGKEGWDVVGVTEGAVVELGTRPSALEKWYQKIRRIDRVFSYKPDSKRVYIILKRPK